MNKTYYHFFCVRDQADSIDAVMNSVLEQTIKPQKIIVVDDGSTDGTSKILAKHQTKFPELIKILRTESRTRDFSRIPKLWNMCLDPQYDFQWIGAGDNIVAKDYAEILLNEFEKDPFLTICSGDVENGKTEAPLGGGRFVKQSFFYRYYTEYPFILGYESEILYKSLFEGFLNRVFPEAKITHAQKLGTKHNFKEFGKGMKTLGYHPTYAFGRCLLDFLANKNIGKLGAVKMFYYYVTFKPDKEGYYRLWDESIRSKITQKQKEYVDKKWYELNRIILKLLKDPRKFKYAKEYYDYFIAKT